MKIKKFLAGLMIAASFNHSALLKAANKQPIATTNLTKKSPQQSKLRAHKQVRPQQGAARATNMHALVESALVRKMLIDSITKIVFSF